LSSYLASEVDDELGNQDKNDQQLISCHNSGSAPSSLVAHIRPAMSILSISETLHLLLSLTIYD
jgi:hypothetical protein